MRQLGEEAVKRRCRPHRRRSTHIALTRRGGFVEDADRDCKHVCTAKAKPWFGVLMILRWFVRPQGFEYMVR
jgi:hypothetical protein